MKWSPTKIPTVPFDVRVLLAVEDGRINRGMQCLGLPIEVTPGDRLTVGHLAAADLKLGAVDALILRAIASIGTNVVDEVLAAVSSARPALRELTEEIILEVRTALEKGRVENDGLVAKFSVVVEIAEKVARKLEALGILDPDKRPSLSEVSCCISHDLCDDDVRRRIAGTPADEIARHFRARRGRGGSQGRSGKMSIATPTLEVPVAPSRFGRRRRTTSTTEGSIPTHIHRLSIDGAIFRRSVRRRGGTFLIDTSGSMSLRASSIDRILREARSATLVAIYSGKGSRGELRIVARDGWRASAENLQPFGSGNIVDLPALQWLAKQPGPRVWITDGGVSGVNDAASPKIHEECERLCRQARVLKAPTIEDALKKL